MAPQPSFILDISDQWEAKRQSISISEPICDGREADSPSFIERLHHEAAYWGKVIGKRYGEPFASREPVGLRSLKELV
ncbi:MAG: hypothetical protein R3C05_12840 [Pirellulaceae bacterium]